MYPLKPQRQLRFLSFLCFLSLSILILHRFNIDTITDITLGHYNKYQTTLTEESVEMNDTVKMIFGLIGGLALFLYGMNSMSDALQKTAGRTFGSDKRH